MRRSNSGAIIHCVGETYTCPPDVQRVMPSRNLATLRRTKLDKKEAEYVQD